MVNGNEHEGKLSSDLPDDIGKPKSEDAKKKDAATARLTQDEALKEIKKMLEEGGKSPRQGIGSVLTTVVPICLAVIIIVCVLIWGFGKLPDGDAQATSVANKVAAELEPVQKSLNDAHKTLGEQKDADDKRDSTIQQLAGNVGEVNQKLDSIVKYTVPLVMTPEIEQQIKDLQDEIKRVQDRKDITTARIDDRKDRIAILQKDSEEKDDPVTKQVIELYEKDIADSTARIKNDTELIENLQSKIDEILAPFEEQKRHGLLGGGDTSRRVEALELQFATLEKTVAGHEEQIVFLVHQGYSHDERITSNGKASTQNRMHIAEVRKDLAKTNAEVKSLGDWQAELKAQFRNEMSNANPASLRSGEAYRAPDGPPVYSHICGPYQQERWITVYGKKPVDGKMPLVFTGIVPYRTEEDLYWFDEFGEWRTWSNDNFSTVVQAYRVVTQ